MGITIKEIAKLSGVSRGTVDRVLNNRGRVSPKSAEKVKRIAKEFGYVPNKAGAALAAKRKNILLGMVMPALGNPFFEEVADAAKAYEKELSEYGVSLRIVQTEGYDEKAQLAAVEELIVEQASGIAIAPISSETIRQKLCALHKAGIPVVTFNSDLKDSQRLCFVGQDYEKSGRTAGGVMSLITGEEAEIYIVTGSHNMLGHNQRIEGFEQIVKTKPHVHIMGIGECFDRDDIAYELTQKVLLENSAVTAIYVTAGGTGGVCKAVCEQSGGRAIRIIAFDSTPENREYLKKGILSVLIGQEPQKQGKLPLKKLYDYILNPKLTPASEFTKLEIEIAQML